MSETIVFFLQHLFGGYLHIDNDTPTFSNDVSIGEAKKKGISNCSPLIKSASLKGSTSLQRSTRKSLHSVLVQVSNVPRIGISTRRP